MCQKNGKNDDNLETKSNIQNTISYVGSDLQIVTKLC